MVHSVTASLPLLILAALVCNSAAFTSTQSVHVSSYIRSKTLAINRRNNDARNSKHWTPRPDLNDIFPSTPFAATGCSGLVRGFGPLRAADDDSGESFGLPFKIASFVLGIGFFAFSFAGQIGSIFEPSDVQMTSDGKIVRVQTKQSRLGRNEIEGKLSQVPVFFAKYETDQDQVPKFYVGSKSNTVKLFTEPDDAETFLKNLNTERKGDGKTYTLGAAPLSDLYSPLVTKTAKLLPGLGNQLVQFADPTATYQLVGSTKEVASASALDRGWDIIELDSTRKGGIPVYQVYRLAFRTGKTIEGENVLQYPLFFTREDASTAYDRMTEESNRARGRTAGGLEQNLADEFAGVPEVKAAPITATCLEDVIRKMETVGGANYRSIEFYPTIPSLQLGSKLIGEMDNADAARARARARSGGGGAAGSVAAPASSLSSVSTSPLPGQAASPL